MTVLGLVAFAVIGASMQAVLEWRDSESYPPPGELVSVGEGREIHVHRSGRPHAGPTIVLEVGGSLGQQLRDVWLERAVVWAQQAPDRGNVWTATDHYWIPIRKSDGRLILEES